MHWSVNMENHENIKKYERLCANTEYFMCHQKTVVGVNELSHHMLFDVCTFVQSSRFKEECCCCSALWVDI